MKSCVCVSSNEIYDQRDDSLSPPLAVKGILGNLLNSRLQRQMERKQRIDVIQTQRRFVYDNINC